jgi:hypothetical protein
MNIKLAPTNANFGKCGMKRRPYGTPAIWGGPAFPALKRGANKRCAYGAGVVEMAELS